MSQAFRTASGGRIDRNRPLRFHFDGRSYGGYDGDTLASALLANGVHLVGRSFKYHRPRGLFGLGVEEPNGLVRIGAGNRTTPNLRATQVELFDGLAAESQNRWPSLSFDLASITGLASRLLPAGFYYKTFKWPAALWPAYEKVIRAAAGLGRPPESPDPDRYEKRHAHAEVVVIGSGPAGLAAALAAARCGARVIVADENPALGGSLLTQPATVDGIAGLDWLAGAESELRAGGKVTLLPRATVFGYYDHDMLAIAERVTDHLSNPPPHLPRERIWHVRARQVVIATGAIERGLAFADNDRPGVMLASAVGGYLHRYGVLCGRRVVVLANNDSAYAVACQVAAAGMTVAAIVDTRASPGAAARAMAEAQGIRTVTRHGVSAVDGRARVSAVDVRALAGDGSEFSGGAERLECDLLAVSGGWAPTIHLYRQAGGKARWDKRLAAFLPAETAAANRAAGACSGAAGLATCLREGHAAGLAAAQTAGLATDAAGRAPESDDGLDPVAEPLWTLPARPGTKRFVDLQNDVTVADLQLAASEGYESVEHLKRYTTLGMGTDQGKTSNLAGLAVLAQATGRTIPEVGTTTFRPPYTAVTLGALAGRDTEEFSHPIRRTAVHDWHLKQGAAMMDAAAWHRPQAYRRRGESLIDAMIRETLAVRGNVGVVDVSTLGKIEIQGPDAVELLDRLYANSWTSVAVGRGRYGIMLREDGFVFDDGVTVRLSENRFLITTTTANAERVMQWIEYCLQTRWQNLKVFATPVTEQWFAAAISGPHARRLLADLGTEVDVSNQAFPMMSVRHGRIADIPARLLRLSFCGELSYEVHVAADFGPALWSAILETGRQYDLTVYGIEAMNVLRIEKGHVTGAELDGRTTADDLGLGGMVSRKKVFVGSALLDRPALRDLNRLQLVGLRAVDANTRIPVGANIVAESRPGPQPYLGHATSLAYSPTLQRHIGLALVQAGRSRYGEILYAASPTAGEMVKVELVSPVFVDPEGERVRA